MAGDSDDAVPCNGCTACCRSQLLVLHRSDDVSAYRTRIVQHPTLGRHVIALQQDENGCVYLTDEGCSIHDRRPASCRLFDCRELYRELIRVNGPEGVAAICDRELIDPKIVRAGMERA